LWLAPGLLLWVLFLPNAPYLVTDYMHLAPDSRVPLWFDFALLGAFSASGLLLGFASVYIVQAIVATRAGAVAGWLGTGTSFGLCAVGIYVGRVLRFNSWDAVQEPGVLLGLALARLADPLGNTLLVATVACSPRSLPRSMGPVLREYCGPEWLAGPQPGASAAGVECGFPDLV
jgi:uncharacterized membrane protein